MGRFPEVMRYIWGDKDERWLLWIALSAFALLVVVKIKFPVIDALRGPYSDWLISVLKSKAFEDIVGDLMTGVVAAYFFYLAVDLLPRRKREISAMRTLNLIIAAVVDAYENQRTYGHEDLISLNDVAVLESPNIKRHRDHIVSLAKKKICLRDFYKLKCALNCVDSRIHDFRSVLPLAVTISPEHVLQWLQLTDRARLLHDEYDNQPVCTDERLAPHHVFGDQTAGTDGSDQMFADHAEAMRLYALTLGQRMVQFLMEVDAWMALPGKPEHPAKPAVQIVQQQEAGLG